VTHLGDLAGGLIDNELAGGMHGDAVSHLAECAMCRREVATHRYVKSMLATSAPQVEPCADFFNRLLLIPQAEPLATSGASAGSRGPWPTWFPGPQVLHGHGVRAVAAAGLAASVVVGLGTAVASSGTAAAGPALYQPPASATVAANVASTRSATGLEVVMRHPSARTAVSAVYRRP
jgi:hypothetical protein